MAEAEAGLPHEITVSEVLQGARLASASRTEHAESRNNRQWRRVTLRVILFLQYSKCFFCL